MTSTGTCTLARFTACRYASASCGCANTSTCSAGNRTAYFGVAEALTNVAKHASAGRAEVVARIEDGMLRVEVRDDGVGGASAAGIGLVGLADRLAVLDGRLEVDSPPGAGTCLTATSHCCAPTARPFPDAGGGVDEQRIRVLQQERGGRDGAGHDLGEQVDPDVAPHEHADCRHASRADGEQLAHSVVREAARAPRRQIGSNA